MPRAVSILPRLLIFLLAGIASAFGSLSHAERLPAVTEGSEVITRTYDERGRLKTFTSADGDLIQYKYDANNNLTRLTYPDNKQVNYTYNSRNLSGVGSRSVTFCLPINPPFCCSSDKNPQPIQIRRRNAFSAVELPLAGEGLNSLDFPQAFASLRFLGTSCREFI